MRPSFRKALSFLAVHLLPSRCFVCDEALPALQQLGACAPCWARLRPCRGPSCRTCGLPVVGAHDRCARCVVAPLPLDRVTAAFVYDDVARRFLLRAKAEGRRELLVPFGRQLAAAARWRDLASGIEAVVCVPSDPWTRLRRGFDPAAEIARGLAVELGVPFDRRRLRRRPRLAPRPSKTLSAPGRWQATGGAFRAGRGGTGAVLLVDDVMTTGATASACARALFAAGAGSVRVAVWARTL